MFYGVAEKKNWTVDEKWQHIIFSDETKVGLDKDRKVYIWRKATKRGDQNALVCTAAIPLVRMYQQCFGAALLTME